MRKICIKHNFVVETAHIKTKLQKKYMQWDECFILYPSIPKTPLDFFLLMVHNTYLPKDSSLFFISYFRFEVVQNFFRLSFPIARSKSIVLRNVFWQQLLPNTILWLLWFKDCAVVTPELKKETWFNDNLNLCHYISRSAGYRFKQTKNADKKDNDILHLRGLFNK